MGPDKWCLSFCFSQESVWQSRNQQWNIVQATGAPVQKAWKRHHYIIYIYIQYTRESLVPSWSTAGSANFDKKLQIQTKGTQRAFRSLLAPQDTWQLDELAQVTAAGHTSLFLWLLWVIVRFRGSPEASWRHQCRMCHHFSHAIVAEGDRWCLVGLIL